MGDLPVTGLSAESTAIEETAQTLCDEVLDEVQDSSFDFSAVVKRFNECLFKLAGEFLLPDLETYVDITTKPGINNTPLPANFHRRLRYCHSVTHNRQVKIYGSPLQMFRWYSVLDRAGQVRSVAPKGRLLYYQLVPSSAETLRINYFAYPQRLQRRDDKPTCLPAHMVEPLLFNYACASIFEKIEDATEGPKNNTEYFNRQFAEAKKDLRTFLGPDENEPIEMEDELYWDEMC